MQIYVVTSGDYSAYGIDAVFSSLEKAQAFIDEVSGDRIEAYEMDPPNVERIREGYQLWYVSMKRDGSVLVATDQSFRGDMTFVDGQLHLRYYVDGRAGDSCEMTLWAKSEEHAIKIVNEKRAQAIAEGRWPQLLAEGR